ncbi:probable inactive receptor kinase At5g67200 [Hordeum vulgare subsp. vulgare]|uniref:Protein kinase domain-containing protein n=1 Tax=Hordeum vulgare subsp. vulgare TaxID=112509 RepID=A0A8I6WJ14_HORVV|nr:probable inactive receptor kinase At5g67200 [Hordeum vulgare subsp. vulgare]
MPAPAIHPLPLLLLAATIATASAAVPPAASHSQPTLPTKGAAAGASHSQPTKPAAPPAAALASAPPAEGALLAAFLAKADPTAHLRFPLAATPCAHPGVTCSGAAGITHLVLEQAGLNGTFPPDTISGLAGLRVLSLKSNALHGPVPDLSALGNLKALFLAGNRFSGPFPASLASLRRLRSIDLSGNRFSGALPPGIEAAFPHLTALRLDSNHFNGSVPAWNQSSLKQLNVSYNDFSGPVPVTASMALMGADAFAGNPGLCGEVVRRECRGSPLVFFPDDGTSGSATPPAQSAGVTGDGPQRQGLPSSSSAARAHKVKKKTALTVAVALAAVLAVLLVCAIIAARRGKKRRRPSTAAYPSPKKSAAASQLSRELDNADIGYVECVPDEEAAAMMMPEEKARRLGRSGCLTFCAGEATSYSLEQLMRASAEVLGRGSVGTTYKAVLDGRLVVIVKRLDAAKIGPAASEAETFEQNMDVIGRLRHPNLVPLRSFFQAKEERLLVYDYQPNGSLHSLIHGSRSSRGKPLHWTSCLKIAEDVAQGLAYIHQASRLVHGNIKSSNVLLGSDFEACLTDNCLSFLLESAEVKDDAAYRAPENMKSNRRLTPKSDVYAFGILLLELLSGKAPLEHSVLAATNLQTYALSGREDEGIDSERLSMIVDIASACVRSSPESRPTAWQVLKMIQEVKETDTTGDNEDGDLTSDS